MLRTPLLPATRDEGGARREHAPEDYGPNINGPSNPQVLLA
jgi:hypothetical protein